MILPFGLQNPLRFTFPYLALLAMVVLLAVCSTSADPWQEATHHYSENKDVRIHYAAMGKGPLVVLIHGFPDFWYTWRHQMQTLKDAYRVVAMDQRGYNLSGQPSEKEAYAMSHLVQDVLGVLEAEGASEATIVGHDWGGAVAWQVALRHPEVTRNLVILNLPHPNGLMRELTLNDSQRRNSAYAQTFKQGSPKDPKVFFGRAMTPQNLAGWVKSPAVRDRYIEAFERSSLSGMMAYYQQNYPDLPPKGYSERLEPAVSTKVQAPVLIFHGLEDRALHANGLNQTWEWLTSEMTLITLPGAGHFVQHDRAELVSSRLRSWLDAHH